MTEEMQTESAREFGEQLDRLKDVLETERRALLDGDAKTVASLAVEKERIADALFAMREHLPERAALGDELERIAKQVEELAALNHVLLREVYQYYHGMLELFMRIGGRGQTYGRNGVMSIDTAPKRDREILA